MTDPKPEKEYHEISSFHLYVLVLDVADSDREVEWLLRAFLLKLSPLTMELTAYLWSNSWHRPSVSSAYSQPGRTTFVKLCMRNLTLNCLWAGHKISHDWMPKWYDVLSKLSLCPFRIRHSVAFHNSIQSSTGWKRNRLPKSQFIGLKPGHGVVVYEHGILFLARGSGVYWSFIDHIIAGYVILTLCHGLHTAMFVARSCTLSGYYVLWV